MRALRLERFGTPAALSVKDIPMPEVAPDEVLVAVKAAAINPSDVGNTRGAMPHTTLPRTPGRDFAGIVEQGPPDLVGQQVWGTGGDLGFTREGTHAEYIALPAAAVSCKPAALSMEQAAAVGVPFVTAYHALVQRGHVEVGDTLLITGANGAVGNAAVQIAHWLGIRVLAVVRRSAEREAVEQLGVTEAIDLEHESLVEGAKRATDGAGASIVFDTTGALFEPCLEALAADGRMVVIAAPRDGRVTFNLRGFYRRELDLRGADTLGLSSVGCARILDQLAPAFESGELHPPDISARYSLGQAVEAYDRVANGGAGKVVLIPS